MSGWIKRLRKKLRNRKPALLLASLLIVILLSVGLTWYFGNETDSSAVNNDAQVVLSPQKWHVVIQKKYLAGPEVVEKGEYSAVELDQLIATFSNMKVIETSEDMVVYEQFIEDISPILKEDGFFAIDPNGVLHLYQGEATEEKIIQTFFQIDIERLETTLPVEEYIQLREGIPFTSLAEYNSILSTYSEYAVSTDDDLIKEH